MRERERLKITRVAVNHDRVGINHDKLRFLVVFNGIYTINLKKSRQSHYIRKLPSFSILSMII